MDQGCSRTWEGSCRIPGPWSVICSGRQAAATGCSPKLFSMSGVGVRQRDRCLELQGRWAAWSQTSHTLTHALQATRKCMSSCQERPCPMSKPAASAAARGRAPACPAAS